MAELTVERLREILHYDPETGQWTWRMKMSSKMPGQIAGATRGKEGYRIIGIGYRRYSAARLAFLYIKGRWPDPEIDHINRNPADNRWKNLREATSRLNKLNRGLNRNNTSGLKGVSWNKRGRKWTAQTRLNYRFIHLGRFDSKEEAHQAYLQYLQDDVYRGE